MNYESAEFRVSVGATVQLAQLRTKSKPQYKSHKHYRQLMEKKIGELRVMQSLLFANNSQSLLIIFQAMDTAGKDSAIKHVMSGVNPQGCHVFSFKHPSNAEQAHDFLWRTNQCLPERGHISVFNRSYYEEVLIVRVKSVILFNESLLAEKMQAPNFWLQRYHSIRELESHLHRNGTRIIKFFLHLSKEEQRLRLLNRIEDPDKCWKFNKEDFVQRASWNEYQRAYEDCLSATNTKEAPWYAIPADDKKNAHLIMSQVILDTLKDLHMTYPKPDRDQQHELIAIRKKLALLC